MKWLALISLIVGAVTYYLISVTHGGSRVAAIIGLSWICFVVATGFVLTAVGKAMNQSTGFPAAATSIAAKIAGRRRNLYAGWLADLAGDPDNGVELSDVECRKMAAGFIAAALRMRLSDAARPLWKPIDWILASQKRTDRVTYTIIGAVNLYLYSAAGLEGVILALPGDPVLHGWLRHLARVLRTRRDITILPAGPGRTIRS